VSGAQPDHPVFDRLVRSHPAGRDGSLNAVEFGFLKGPNFPGCSWIAAIAGGQQARKYPAFTRVSKALVDVGGLKFGAGADYRPIYSNRCSHAARLALFAAAQEVGWLSANRKLRCYCSRVWRNWRGVQPYLFRKDAMQSEAELNPAR